MKDGYEPDDATGNRWSRFLVSGLVSRATLSPLYPPPRSGRLRRGVTGERRPKAEEKLEG